jgi:hypothetical protein
MLFIDLPSFVEPLLVGHSAGVRSFDPLAVDDAMSEGPCAGLLQSISHLIEYRGVDNPTSQRECREGQALLRSQRPSPHSVVRQLCVCVRIRKWCGWIGRALQVVESSTTRKDFQGPWGVLQRQAS